MQPPAKDEAGEDVTPLGMDSFSLPSTTDDDFHSAFEPDSSASLRSLLDESLVYLRNARSSLATQGLSPQLLEDVRRCAKANLARLAASVRHSTAASMVRYDMKLRAKHIKHEAGAVVASACLLFHLGSRVSLLPQRLLAGRGP